jgi:hypothetical protein
VVAPIKGVERTDSFPEPDSAARDAGRELRSARWRDRLREGNDTPPGVGLMAQVKKLSEWMADRGIGLPELIEASGVEGRVVEAIAHGRYTPSPEQRRCLCAVLGIAVDQVAWGHVTEISHVYGHGPQFGRSP